ncbi:helix-turn-helix transcriptional regulator [Vibrio sp. SCSIO 43135]|uniref:helix-turn-helix domain-containing protein n=1 Tax=Vibrio sp. SCSIO 43135 TaxID=2819096 RepID=UPI002075CAA3|nr:AraC family transcriptional regulator [Vibrio sp. SCSIO 43135]USD43243.1 helix-turn-helix transcriptional regulator [Vibrio sp. SCSIO 43135]
MSSESYEIPVIRSTYLKEFITLFTKAGLNPDNLIFNNGLPLDLMQSDGDFVPNLSLNRLINAAADELGVEKTLDILFTHFKTLAVPHVLHQFEAYSTIGEALQHAKAIFSLDSPGSSVLAKSINGQFWLCRSNYQQPEKSITWHEPFFISYVIALIQHLTHSDWLPTQVKLQVTDDSIVNQIVGASCQLYIGHEDTEILLPQHILDKKIEIPPNTLGSQQPHVEWYTSFSDSVFELLEQYSREQNLSVQEAADILGYSQRTLQRKLQAENLSFGKIKDSVMYTNACRLMGKGHSLTYISTQLGYQNVSHFSRSFKRISGTTPKEYLKALRE